MTGGRGRLLNRAVVITGAGGGLGRAMARLFAAEGANLVCTDIDGAAAVDAARGAGPRAVALSCDVLDDAAAKAAVDYALERFGGLYGLVNNAAAPALHGTVAELPLAQWTREISVTLTGAFLMSKYAVPAIAAGGGGAIIHVASQFAGVGVGGSIAYCTAKAGLVNFARTMALDHAGQGIRVNSLSPGAIATSRLIAGHGSLEAAERALAPMHPTGRIAQPEEIANAALFLLSDDSSFMTGADLLVDGGYTAR